MGHVVEVFTGTDEDESKKTLKFYCMKMSQLSFVDESSEEEIGLETGVLGSSRNSQILQWPMSASTTSLLELMSTGGMVA